MTIKKVSADERKEIRIGLLGFGFMGRCHTNAYRKIPQFFPGGKLNPNLQLLFTKTQGWERVRQVMGVCAGPFAFGPTQA